MNQENFPGKLQKTDDCLYRLFDLLWLYYKLKNRIIKTQEGIETVA
jgi:hypothetical protein